MRLRATKMLKFFAAICLTVFVVSSQLRYSFFYHVFWKHLNQRLPTEDKLEKAKSYLTSFNAQQAKILGFPGFSNPESDFFSFSPPLEFAEFKMLAQTQLNHNNNNNDNVVCVVVQSANRPVPYVLRTVASLLFAASQPNSPPIQVAIVDLGMDASVRDILQHAHVNISVFSRQFLQNQFSFFPPVGSNEMDEKQEWFLQQRGDYALSLSVCQYTPSCSSCLVLENDALLSSQALRVLSVALSTLEHEEKNWALLRLFRTDQFEGWEQEYKDYFQLGLCMVICAHSMSRVFKKKSALYTGAVLGLLVPLLVGKQHLPLVGTTTWRGLVPADRYGSVSSVAHVYPRSVLGYLIQEINRPLTTNTQRRVPIDLFVGDVFLQQVPLPTLWELVPNPVEHIGDVSSFSQSEIRLIQSASFEPEAFSF